jgi:hypothetical protein
MSDWPRQLLEAVMSIKDVLAKKRSLETVKPEEDMGMMSASDVLLGKGAAETVRKSSETHEEDTTSSHGDWADSIHDDETDQPQRASKKRRQAGRGATLPKEAVAKILDYLDTHPEDDPTTLVGINSCPSTLTEKMMIETGLDTTWPKTIVLTSNQITRYRAVRIVIGPLIQALLEGFFKEIITCLRGGESSQFKPFVKTHGASKYPICSWKDIIELIAQQNHDFNVWIATYDPAQIQHCIRCSFWSYNR